MKDLSWDILLWKSPKLKHVQKFNYVVNIVVDDVKCDTDIWRRFGIANLSLHKLKEALRDRTVLLETRKNDRNTTLHLFSFMTIFAQMKFTNQRKCGAMDRCRKYHGLSLKGKQELKWHLYLESQMDSRCSWAVWIISLYSLKKRSEKMQPPSHSSLSISNPFSLLHF